MRGPAVDVVLVAVVLIRGNAFHALTVGEDGAADAFKHHGRTVINLVHIGLPVCFLIPARDIGAKIGAAEKIRMALDDVDDGLSRHNDVPGFLAGKCDDGGHGFRCHVLSQDHRIAFGLIYRLQEQQQVFFVHADSELIIDGQSLLEAAQNGSGVRSLAGGKRIQGSINGHRVGGCGGQGHDLNRRSVEGTAGDGRSAQQHKPLLRIGGRCNDGGRVQWSAVHAGTVDRVVGTGGSFPDCSPELAGIIQVDALSGGWVHSIIDALPELP